MKQLGYWMMAVAAFILLLLAAILVGYAGYQIVKAIIQAPQLLAAGDFGYTIIDAVGYVVIAVAILDVTKHLFEEQVLEQGLHSKSTFRSNFARFVTIISIAVFLEGLVLVFKVTQDDVKLLVYPVLLLLVGVAMTIALAIFTWLGADRDPSGDASH
ncbi:hypothetical protein ACWGTO_07195 [Mesorhizobium sp. PL10]